MTVIQLARSVQQLAHEQQSISIVTPRDSITLLIPILDLVESVLYAREEPNL